MFHGLDKGKISDLFGKLSRNKFFQHWETRSSFEIGFFGSQFRNPVNLNSLFSKNPKGKISKHSEFLEFDFLSRKLQKIQKFRYFY